jgi:hypothetical protein
VKRRSELLVDRVPGGHRLPGGATSPDEITDLQLLNRLDQIRDAAIFSPSLEQKTRETIVRAADSVKRRTVLLSKAPEFGANSKAKLLNTLSNQVAKITDSAELDEEKGKKVLTKLNPYVPEEDLLKDLPAE